MAKKKVAPKKPKKTLMCYTVVQEHKAGFRSLYRVLAYDKGQAILAFNTHNKVFFDQIKRQARYREHFIASHVPMEIEVQNHKVGVVWIPGGGNGEAKDT